MIGKVFEYLTILELAEPHVYPSGRERKRYKCICKCGNITYVMQNQLKSKKSCGCWKREPCHNVKYLHGLNGTSLNRLWCNIKNRCNNPKCQYYHIYGGRGIKMCEEWANDFLVFYNWANLNGYKKGMHIDRRDNNMGYSPDNCRFVTPKENMNNRRSNITIGICGEFKTFTQWCEALNVNCAKAYATFRRTGDVFNSLAIA